MSKNSVVQSGRFTTHVGGSGGMPDVHRHCGGVFRWGEFFREEEIAKKKQRFPGGYTITLHQGFFTDHFQWFPGGYTITLHQGVSRIIFNGSWEDIP